MVARQQGSLDALLHRPQPSWLQLCYASPLAQTLYSCRSWYQSPSPPEWLANPVTVVCISDTHNQFPEVPKGDLLIHAGDLSQGGSSQEIQRTLDWLAGLPHHFKIVIAGNHDLLLNAQNRASDTKNNSLDWHDLIYLQDSAESLKLPGGRVLNVFGSPWTRKHGDWAFEYPKGVDKWTKTVPEETDILITHMPPFGHLDFNGLGDQQLLREVRRIRPRLHVFGHIHAGYGDDTLHHDVFEANFEAVMGHEAGLLGLLKMVGNLVSIFVAGVSRQSLCCTRLVNAATMGGPGDSDMRTPIIVTV